MRAKTVIAAALAATLAVGYAVPAARRRDDLARLAGDPRLHAIAARMKERAMRDVSPVRLLAVTARLENFRDDPAHCRSFDPEARWRGEVVYYSLFMIPVLHVEVTCGGNELSYESFR